MDSLDLFECTTWNFVEQHTIEGAEGRLDGNEGSDNGFENEEHEVDEYRINSGPDMKRVDFIGLSCEDVKLYHFRSLVVSFDFYNTYAQKRGCAARRCNVVKNKRGEVTQQVFMCFKEGFRLKKHLVRVDRKKEPRAMTRCGCLLFVVSIFNERRGGGMSKLSMMSTLMGY
ncbi:FAR1 DNA-binding domain [Sesbania bispinosa]|nr:FAR1 DNA-binding domain [Sesbania bispinosa]